MDKEEKIEAAKIEEIDKKIEISKPKKDNSLLIAIIGFILGAIFVIIILKTNMFKNNGNLVITKNETQVYEKNSLAAAVDKIYDAVVLVSAYKGEHNYQQDLDLYIKLIKIMDIYLPMNML